MSIIISQFRIVKVHVVIESVNNSSNYVTTRDIIKALSLMKCPKAYRISVICFDSRFRW